jgi:hypothetical protein
MVFSDSNVAVVIKTNMEKLYNFSIFLVSLSLSLSFKRTKIYFITVIATLFAAQTFSPVPSTRGLSLP